MKRLFQVNGQYFESKKEAKANRGPKSEAGHYPHAVSKGPDHIHYGRKYLTPNAHNGRRRCPASHAA